MNAEKWHHSEIRTAINDESQRSIAKNLRRDELLVLFFLTHGVDTMFVRSSSSLADLFFSRPRSEGWPHHGRTFHVLCSLLHRSIVR